MHIYIYDFGKKEPLLEKSLCNKYIYDGNNIIYRTFATKKGVGEAIALRKVLNHIPNSDIIYKLSGRYRLNENFNVTKIEDGFNFVVYKDGGKLVNKDHYYVRGASYSTRLYAICGEKYLKQWRKSLLLAIPLMIIKGLSIESAMPFFICKNINYHNYMGVEGYIAGKDYINE